MRDIEDQMDRVRLIEWTDCKQSTTIYVVLLTRQREGHGPKDLACRRDASSRLSTNRFVGLYAMDSEVRDVERDERGGIAGDGFF